MSAQGSNRRVVRWSPGRSKRRRQMRAVSRRLQGGYCAFRATMACRNSSVGSRRRSAVGDAGSSKRLCMPTATKRTALRRSVRARETGARARVLAGCPKRTIGLRSSWEFCSGEVTNKRSCAQSSAGSWRGREPAGMSHPPGEARSRGAGMRFSTALLPICQRRLRPLTFPTPFHHLMARCAGAHPDSV